MQIILTIWQKLLAGIYKTRYIYKVHSIQRGDKAFQFKNAKLESGFTQGVVEFILQIGRDLENIAELRLAR